MEIRQASLSEASLLGKFAALLWSGHSSAEMTEECTALLQQTDAAFFIAYEKESPVGFARCQLRRDYVEGTSTSPVGYLEGVFVLPACRRQGIARQLVNTCQQWARAQGCLEFASDCEVDNAASRSFHTRIGFTEANQIICYTKKLS